MTLAEKHLMKTQTIHVSLLKKFAKDCCVLFFIYSCFSHVRKTRSIATQYVLTK